MMNKKIFVSGLMILMFQVAVMAKVYEVSSPSGNLTIKVSADKNVVYSVFLDGKEIIAPSAIRLTLDNGVIFGGNPKVKKVSRKSISEVITPVIPRKYKTIKDECNELRIDFKSRYSLVLRAYDDGVAYRWVSEQKGEYKVQDELASFNFDNDHSIWFPEEESMFSHQERVYKYIKLSEITPERFCSTGTLVDFDDGVKVFISEADLISYPGMFLKGSNDSEFGLVGKYPGYPL